MVDTADLSDPTGPREAAGYPHGPRRAADGVQGPPPGPVGGPRVRSHLRDQSWGVSAQAACGGLLTPLHACRGRQQCAVARPPDGAARYVPGRSVQAKSETRWWPPSPTPGLHGLRADDRLTTRTDPPPGQWHLYIELRIRAHLPGRQAEEAGSGPLARPSAAPQRVCPAARGQSRWAIGWCRAGTGTVVSGGVTFRPAAAADPPSLGRRRADRSG